MNFIRRKFEMLSDIIKNNTDILMVSKIELGRPSPNMPFHLDMIGILTLEAFSPF